MMQLGRGDGSLSGSGTLKSGNPARRAAAVLKATTFFDDPDGIQAVFDAVDAVGSHWESGSPGKMSRWSWPMSREPVPA